MADVCKEMGHGMGFSFPKMRKIIRLRVGSTLDVCADGETSP